MDFVKNRGNKCFKYGQIGHIQSDCPSKVASRVNKILLLLHQLLHTRVLHLFIAPILVGTASMPSLPIRSLRHPLMSLLVC